MTDRCFDFFLCRSKGFSEQPAAQSPKNFEREVLKAHNDYRALHGVPPLELDKNLCKHALEWAKVGFACNSDINVDVRS